MNPIDDLVKLVAANPNVKDAELYKSFPQLKGTNLTRARAFALGKSRGYDEDELSEAFSDVIRLFAPKGTPMVKNVSYREVAPKPEPRPVSPIDALTPVDKINYKPAEQKQVEFDPEDPLGNIEKTVWEQSNELRKRRGEINSIYGKRDNTSNNIHLPDINNEVADIHFQEAELNKTYQQVKKTVEQTGLPLSEFDANEQLQKWAKTKDLNGLSIQQIGKQIPQTTTAKAVLKTYENYRDFNDAIKTSQSIEQAALIWKQSKLLKDPREAAKSEYEQLKTLTQRTDNHNLIPESKMGEVLAEFLMQPAAQEWSKQSQQNHQSYMGAYANLMNHYPSFAKGVMATKIANAREAKGWNNGFINFSSEKGNDEVVEELFKKGEITQQEKLFYDRNKSGVNSQVKTPGLVNSLARGFVHGMRNMAGTIEDVTGMLSSSDVLANKLQKESSESGLDVKGFHSFINSMGEFTGEMVPMMLLTKSLTGVGVSPAIANATSVGLLFEHPNREDAVSMFPGQPGKQVAYTAVKTAFDMGLGLLYDRSKALDGLLKEAQPQIKSIITEFSENKITAEAAKDAVKNTLSTYIEKARDLGIKTMQHNVKQSAQMAGFTVGKDILDNVFGGRDVSFSEMVLNAGESAKTAFVSGGLLSAMAAHGESKVPGRITSRQVYDIVSRPEYYKDLINRDHSLTKEQKAERLQNIEDGVSIFSDLNNETQLTEKQKAKVLLHELNQKVIDRKLEGLTSQGLIDKLKEQKKASAEIVTNIFKARDYQLSKVEEREAEKITEIKEEAPEVGGDTVDDIYFMSSKELIERKAEAKKEDKQRLIDAMGKEWHDKYLMADRETKSQMEDALTKEQKDIFGGVGLKDRDNPEVLQGLIRIVSALETVESKDVLASRARQAITDIVNGRNKKESFAILNAVSKRAEELGFSKNEMKEATINDFKERIDYEDAKDILNTFFGNGIEKSEVRIKKEQTYTTKSGKYSVEYENGKRVVKDKEGNTVPEYNGTTRNKVVYNVLKEHDEAYNFNHGEKADQSKAPQFNDPKEADRWVIENSTNPTEIAEIYQSNPKETHPLSAKEQAIADHGIGKVKESSYREFGDENNINNNKARAYFKKDGSTLDVIAKEISDRTGIEVEPHDIIEFIDRFPNGVSEALAKRDGEVRQAAATKFKELTGIDLTDRVAKNAALQGYEAEKIKQAEEALGKEIKSESLPEEELAKLLEEESRRIYEESENIDNLDTYATQSGEHTEPSPKNREQPQSESQIGQTTGGQETGSGRGNLQDPSAEQASDGAAYATGKQYGRIDVAPISGGEAKQLSEIIYSAGKSLKQRILYLKPSPGSRKALGSYNPNSKAVKIKFEGDLDVTAHEIGHAIDDQYRIVKEIEKDPAALLELDQFSKFGSKPPKNHPDPQKYINGEGLAEWIRAFVVNPAEAQKTAPKVHAIYERTVSPEAKKSLTEFSNDVRAWAGASASDMILSNVAVEHKENSLLDYLTGKKSSNEFSISWLDKLAANFVNPMRAFEKAFDYAKGLKGIDDVLPANDPTVLARVLLGIDGKFGEILKTGMINSRGEVLKSASGKPMNIEWLLEPLDRVDEKSATKSMKDVISYMVAERTVELSNRFGREDVLTGVGAGIFKDAEVAKKALNEFATHPRLAETKEAAARYREFSDAVLKYLVDKGRLSQDQYNQIKQDNVQYVAMQRVIEAEPNMEINVFGKGGKSLGAKKDVINKIKGSTKTIVNPYVSLLDGLYKSVKEADRNETLKAFRDVLVENRGMYDGDVKRLSDIGVRGAEGDKNAITIFVEGKPEKWVFQEDVYRALKGLDGDAYKLPGLVTLPARVLRWTVTNFPTFAARNWVRDFQDRVIKSNNSRGLNGFSNIIGPKEDWNAVARAGGLNAGYYLKDKASYYGLLRESLHDMSKRKNIVVDAFKIKHWIQQYHDVLYKSETSNRVAEYRSAFEKAKRKGMDDYNASIYAAHQARDLIDFAVAGHYAKVINQIIPFTNAAIQGLRSTAIKAKENPGAFAARTMLYSVIPQMVLWYLNHRDDDTAKEYEALPAYQRDMYWNHKIGPDKWLSVPKPFELSLLGSGIDRLLSQEIAGNDKAFDGFGGTLKKSLLPVDETALGGGLIKPVAEIMANKDMFRDKRIVPAHEENLDLSLRKTERASGIGKWLQGQTGWDARYIDYFIQTQFSYFGNMAVKASSVNDKKSTAKFDITDIGFIKHSPGYNSPAVQELMEYAKKWNLIHNRSYKVFQNLSSDYFDAKSDEEKEEKAAMLREYATKLLETWKEKKMDEKAQNKAAKKKG